MITVEARGDALAPAELVARIRARRQTGSAVADAVRRPGRRGARRLRTARRARPGPGGRARGESRYVDPYTGALLAEPRGEGFFRTTMQIHRWLAVDAVGKQIVGASTVALVYFCLSGLYLRWPRRWNRLRAWLALDWGQKGRNFLWHLHSVVGTWVLLAYLAMALTGLQWSYGWYRGGLYPSPGVPQRARAGGSRRPASASGADGDRGGRAWRRRAARHRAACATFARTFPRDRP